jgi:hypothetical protein
MRHWARVPEYIKRKTQHPSRAFIYKYIWYHVSSRSHYYRTADFRI